MFNYCLSVLAVTVFPWALGAAEPQASSNHQDSANSTVSSLIFECPTDNKLPKSQNDIDGYWDEYEEHNEENLRDLTKFRTNTYGARAQIYSDMKEMARPYKKRAFGNNLQSGELIYESACGEGFNLFMTLEILKEERGIVNLTAYGNDYLAKSVEVANRLFDQEAADWFRKGKICRADSTALTHVPSSSIDLAYTGFVDPLVDPLGLWEDMDTESYFEKAELSLQLCDSKDPKEQELAKREQLLQENWHDLWVKELVRIVKPGKVVIIEDVGYPLCNKEGVEVEWGGVSKKWWADAIAKYGWDVVPNSLEIDESDWYDNRYNVMMRRNPANIASSEQRQGEQQQDRPERKEEL